jgi:hypothetical protein
MAFKEPKIPEELILHCQPVKLPASFEVNGGSLVFNGGLTNFHHLPHLPSADKVAKMLKQFEEEFMPIILRRGYNVRTVSEMCCCADGANYELGGN